MAKLFLSYSRKDDAKARRLAGWLEREDHDVWRDEDDIGGGASFSSEIESALTECDAVLVLWSAESVKSAWVRDEAAFGRDAAKLIPLSIDGTEPPLGFRQFQAIGLGRWKGHSEPPGADRIRRAIARIADLPPPTPTPAVKPSRPRFSLGRLQLVAVAIAVAAAVILGFFFWQRWSSDREIAIAVQASPQSPDRAMAADYANVAAGDMASFLPRQFDQATVIAPSDDTSEKSGYRMQISTDPHGPAANASLTLSDTDGRTTLWSKSWSVADAAGADLKAQVSEAASRAAVCLTEARGGSRRLTQPALGLYLSGCTGLGDTKLSNEYFVSIFDRVTKLAPDFARGWDYLALSRSWIAESLVDSAPAAHSAAERSARAAIKVARQLNPNSAMSYDAEYHLNSSDNFVGLRILEQGAKVDPEDGRIQMHLSDEFMSVGRVSASVQAGQRGVELLPDAPYTMQQYILALIYSGEFSRAKAAIADAEKKWPHDFAIDYAEFSLESRYGDPRAALELLPKVSDASDADNALYRQVLAARLDPTPSKVDEAIAALEARWGKDPHERNKILIPLGNFGRVEQIYQLLQDPTFQPFVRSEILFRPDFAAVRADPRFMQVAAQLGLVRYWSQTGYWPDFCTSERLRYDCKTEAAKYQAVAR